MTYTSARSDARPVAPSPVQGPPQLIIERDFHAHTLAMFCYAGKHQSASKGLHTDGMEEPLSATFARNLRDRMLALGMTQQELARKSGVAQATISLYLHSQRRPTGASGIDPSPTLARLQALAQALNTSAPALLLSDGERLAFANEALQSLADSLRGTKPHRTGPGKQPVSA